MNDEQLRKKRLQFAKRRDVGEQLTISDLPAGLIEASKKILVGDEEKENAIKKIAIKAPYRSHITMYPKDESGTKIRLTSEQEEVLNTLLDALVVANCTPNQVLEFFGNTELISEGMHLITLTESTAVREVTESFLSRLDKLISSPLQKYRIKSKLDTEMTKNVGDVNASFDLTPKQIARAKDLIKRHPDYLKLKKKAPEKSIVAVGGFKNEAE